MENFFYSYVIKNSYLWFIIYELIKIIRRLGFAMDNNRNIPGQEQDKREAKEYNLYTEKIVKKPGNKIKRAVKHVAKVIGSAVIF